MDAPPALNRRDVFKLGLLAAAGASAVALPAGAQDPKEPPQKNPWQLVVDIPGAPEASKTAVAVEIDPVGLEVIARGRRRGSPQDEFRVFGPGDAHYGQARFTCRCTLGGSKELHTWWLDTSRGANIRKNITVTLFRRDTGEARRYNLMECFPTKWDAGDYSPSSTTRVETIVVKIGHVEFA